MRLTPGYIVAVATFYDQLDTQPVGRHRVYVCTNISCSLRGGDELLEAIEHEMAEDPDVYVRHFECLGACDIAPMAASTASTSGRSSSRRCRSWRSRSARARPRCPTSRSCAGRAPIRRPTPASSPGPNPLAQRAVPDASIPVRPPEQGTYGEQMPGDQPGPSAPLEDR